LSSKIISSHRYSKTTKKKKEKQKNINKVNNIKGKFSDLGSINSSDFKSKKVVKEKKVKNKTDLFNNKIFKVACLCFALFLIGILSRKIVKFENIPLLNVFSNSDENENLDKNYDFKIGLSNIDTTDSLKTNNIILNEILLKTKLRLISINTDYTINYLLANKIEKINNLEYRINISKEYNLKAKNVVDSINKIKEIGSNNIYYKQLSNIESANVESDYLADIKLKTEDPYFIYTLNFPIYDEGYLESVDSEYKISNTSQNSVTFSSNSSKSNLKSINVMSYADTDNMVSDFRNNSIDMFVASTDSVVQLVGKHDYSIKKYRDGETTFLLGNKNSVMFSRKEVRQALLYAMNRDEIVKQVNSSFGETIDLPYIYSGIKYKYDVYGAENSLLSNGWKKVSGLYSKDIDGTTRSLEMNLLVNESDSNKVQIAEKINQMLGAIGVNINIVKLNQEDINNRVKSGDYDIVLASVYINEIPDISFIESYLNINNATNEAIDLVKNSSVENISSNIQNLQNVLSSEIACIGIMARNEDIVYQKYILGFENTNYMNIFNGFKNIGKEK
jgi:peptide/nickel transport system substrate-binding protein